MKVGCSRNTPLICNIFAAERLGEREGIKHWDNTGNKKLLWHGTKAENIVGILQTGFRIAPKFAERTGAMFGEGIYFADQFDKSYQYSNSGAHRSSKKTKPTRRYMLLCEVALGNQKKLYQSEQVTKLPNKNFQSVMGVGKQGPNPNQDVYLPNGMVVPLGKKCSTPQPKLPKNVYWSLQHNEYVVYNTTQVRIRYLLELRD